MDAMYLFTLSLRRRTTQLRGLTNHDVAPRFDQSCRAERTSPKGRACPGGEMNVSGARGLIMENVWWRVFLMTVFRKWWNVDRKFRKTERKEAQVHWLFFLISPFSKTNVALNGLKGTPFQQNYFALIVKCTATISNIYM